MLASIAEREHYRQKSIIINCLSHSVGADIKYINYEVNHEVNQKGQVFD